MEDIEEERERLRKDLEEKCRKAAEERGEKFEIIEKVIPFTNDDVPKYLERLERCMGLSKESKLYTIKAKDYRKVA